MDQFDVQIIKDETTPDGIRVIYVRTCREVCSSQIGIAVKDGTILEVVFAGGCSGNTQGIGRLVEGMRVEEALGRLKGIRCGGKGTSCPDQLARALELIQK